MNVSWGADPLVERSDTLERLRELAETAAGVCGQVAVVSGEAGLGKSTLLEALGSALLARTEKRVCVGVGRCDDLFTPRQLGVFSDMASVLGPAVQDLLSTPNTPAVLFPRVLAALDSLPAGSVLIFEDVHWADHASLDLLKFIARRIVPLRVLIVLTYRPDDLSAEHPLTRLLGDLPASKTTRIELKPLSRNAVDALAAVAGRDGDRLYRITGGNPFFLSEILAQPDDQAVLPSSVRDAVLARAARVSPEERRLLDTLCVAPDPVPERLIEQMQGTSGLAACAALEDRGLLLRDANGELRFRHELARLAMLESLSLKSRAAQQRRLLDAYLNAKAPIKPDLIVHHAAAINDPELLLEYAPRAAARAAALGDCKEAAALYALALKHVARAEPELAATLYEEWAHQTSLFEVNDAVIDARREAVRRWEALDRPERVGDNLRWLWRLYWYLGRTDESEAAAAESLRVLESIPPSVELGRAYSLRSHMSLLRGQRADSIAWGREAIAVAERFDDVLTRAQALVTTATARLFDGDESGRELMEVALELGREHEGLHEETARVYTNYAEYAIFTSDWGLAERLVREGLAFDIKHGLDSWTTYLKGRHAQLQLHRGRLAQAETLAVSALDEEGQAVLMRLPAMTTLATARSRLGAEGADAQLGEVLEIALTMREQQRITPVRLALIQHHYILGDEAGARQQVEAMLRFGTEVLRPWDSGALRVWMQRLDVSSDAVCGAKPTEAQRLELAGDYLAASAALDELQLPFEAAVCRLVATRRGAADLASEAEAGFAAIGCQPGVDAARQLLSNRGVKPPAATGKRGPYKAARKHPLGLTRREVEILALMAEGASNADIAEALSRSSRTVEHHVSSILGKLNAANRLEATLRVIAEPWIAQR